MDELSVVLKARKFIKTVAPQTIPVSVQEYADQVGAVVRNESDLKPDEPGWSFQNNGKYYISVNAKDSDERQRFTVCHELAHIILGLPSDHQAGPSWSYARKSKNEIFCDVFASELLLPSDLFRPLLDEAEIGLAAVDDLARRFEASTLATGSRFAALSRTPCAFVLSEKGIVRYTSRSVDLRESNAWVPPRLPLPKGSVAERVRSGAIINGHEEIEADLWFSDWNRCGALLEEARHLSRWDQTIALMWFEDGKCHCLRPPGESERNKRWDWRNLMEFFLGLTRNAEDNNLTLRQLFLSKRWG